MANLLSHILWIQCVLLLLPFVSRNDAFFVYPRNGGLVKFIMSVGVPIKLGKKQNMSFSVNLQYQYTQATNYSQISSQWPPVYARGKRDADRATPSDRALAYLALEKLLEKYGIDGRQCLLRSICENGLSNLHHDGLYGELMHIFLTPDYGDGETEPDLNLVYLEAQRAGEAGLDCELVFKSCPPQHALMDMVSILQDI